MEYRFLAYEVADLCLGKPPLRSLSASATVADAIAAIKSSGESFVSVWSCDHSASKRNTLECTCVGKICMVDVICHLCREDNLGSPGLALKAPVSVLVSKVNGLVRHVEPSCSLLDAIDLMLQGAHNLVIPIKSSSKKKQFPRSSSSSITPTVHNGQEFCWLTQEDVIRFLLGSIGLFSPIPTLSIETLGIIKPEFPAVKYHSAASTAVKSIFRTLVDQMSVAVVDNQGVLIGEISPFHLSSCDETVAAAVMALSAGDLLAYIDCGGPPEEIVRLVEEQLKNKNLEGMLEEFLIGPCNANNSASCDEELSPPSRPGWYSPSGSYSVRLVRRAEAIVCHPWSSLVAVMVQAIAHRVNYVWVIEEDGTVVGIVTFASMLKVFRKSLESMI